MSETLLEQGKTENKFSSQLSNLVNFGSFCKEDKTDYSLFPFKLPKKHKPGTDLISKLILTDAEVINIVTSTIVGKCS